MKILTGRRNGTTTKLLFATLENRGILITPHVSTTIRIIEHMYESGAIFFNERNYLLDNVYTLEEYKFKTDLEHRGKKIFIDNGYEIIKDLFAPYNINNVEIIGLSNDEKVDVITHTPEKKDVKIILYTESSTSEIIIKDENVDELRKDIFDGLKNMDENGLIEIGNTLVKYKDIKELYFEGV